MNFLQNLRFKFNKYYTRLSYTINGKCISNRPQSIIKDMDVIPSYDYSIFDPQVFLRPYNGEVVKAIDYELSRGVCLLVIIALKLLFKDIMLKKFPLGNILILNYLRSNQLNVYSRKFLIHNEFGIKLFRCQDTNFLSINRKMLLELSEMIDNSQLDIMLYIETRPEGINPAL